MIDNRRQAIVVSVDPAKHGCGLAIFQGDILLVAGYAKNENKDNTLFSCCRAAAESALAWIDEKRAELLDEKQALDDELPVELLVCEKPQIYPRQANKTKGDPNKIVLPLTMACASLAALLSGAAVAEYLPHDWKGSGTAKPESVAAEKKGKVYIVKQMVTRRLAEGELARIDWTGSVERSWDVADAIGVGMHHLGRFGRARAFARE